MPPSAAYQLIRGGYTVLVEQSAPEWGGLPDQDYANCWGQIRTDLHRAGLLEQADLDLANGFAPEEGVRRKMDRQRFRQVRRSLLTRKRPLSEVQRDLKAAGKPFRAFLRRLNLGRCERQSLERGLAVSTGKKKEQALAKKEQDFRDLILRAYRAESLPENGFFHGKNAGRLVVVGPINLPVGRLFVEEVITACRKRGATRVDILAFEFEMGLFPAALDEAKQKGIDVAPKTIPPEVFDKRAVEKGQVRFHDVAYIEVTPRYDTGNKLALAVELTDFSVYYTQGLVDSITAELKAGKSEVVCEQGQLIKVSKDKNGVVRQEVLTKQWTDWVDYWAVDFDYESRRRSSSSPRTSVSQVSCLDSPTRASSSSSRSGGPAATSSRTSGRASGPERIARWR